MVSIEVKSIKQNQSSPVLDFISGNTETVASKRLTKSIRSPRTLWLLAKMADNVRKMK